MAEFKARGFDSTMEVHTYENAEKLRKDAYLSALGGLGNTDYALVGEIPTCQRWGRGGSTWAGLGDTDLALVGEIITCQHWRGVWGTPIWSGGGHGVP